MHGPYHIEMSYANGVTIIIDHKSPNGVRAARLQILGVNWPRGDMKVVASLGLRLNMKTG